MKIEVNQDTNIEEIDSLEAHLLDFQKEWKIAQTNRSQKWRQQFIVCFILAILVTVFAPKYFWLSLVVIAYFAGSLFSLLRQNAKTSQQISEHKKQLRLVRLLRNFETSPFSQKSRD